MNQRRRGGVYVDGFNLYHALDDYDKPYLKWVCLRRLSERFARGHAHSIDRIFFCTAFFPGDFNKRKRHEEYNRALFANDVDVLLGHTAKEPIRCHACGHMWDQPKEKETDINVALSMFDDAAQGLIDVAFLLTADTDQAATLKFMKRRFPEVTRIVVTPPGRRKSKHLRDLSHSNIGLNEDDIDASILPALIQPDSGRLITRPDEYAPPPEWVHPDERP